MTFQAYDKKDHHFLDLLDNNKSSLEPTYSKGRTWLKYFRHSNFLCTRVMRAIVYHTPIGEYQLRFFPKKDFKCPCGEYPIEIRQHILFDCKRYNKYWNSRRDTIGHFTLFSEFNSNTFAFGESITWSLLYFVISFSFSLFFFLFFSYASSFFYFYSCGLCLNVYSYKVATTVCLHAPCNKLLILKKRLKVKD